MFLSRTGVDRRCRVRRSRILLTDLPADILVLLPPVLHSIDDLYSLISTCRALYNSCYDENLKLRPKLARRDGQYLLQPHPHLLIAGTSHQVADWAVLSTDNRAAFHNAVRGGLPGLLTLCQDVARMSLIDMRYLHALKASVLDPLADRLRSEAHEKTPDFRGHKLRFPDLCIMNMWIFSDLFHHHVTACYHPVDVPAPLTNAIRYDYLRYCVPDTKAGPINFASGHVQYRGHVFSQSWPLSSQQRDLVLLEDCTTFNWNSIFGYLALLRDQNPLRDARGAMILMYSGIVTLRFILALCKARAHGGPDRPFIESVAKEGGDDPDDVAAVRIAVATMEEIVQSRDDAYKQIARRSDPCFNGILGDCHHLWRRRDAR